MLIKRPKRLTVVFSCHPRAVDKAMLYWFSDVAIRSNRLGYHAYTYRSYMAHNRIQMMYNTQDFSFLFSSTNHFRKSQWNTCICDSIIHRVTHLHYPGLNSSKTYIMYVMANPAKMSITKWLDKRKRYYSGLSNSCSHWNILKGNTQK